MALITISTFESCKKYEEGPGFSLRSRTERVSNNWKVENYKINGADYTSLLSGYSEVFEKSGAYSYHLDGVSGTGQWTFQNDDETIKVNGTDAQASRTLIILKLEEKSFWYYYMDGTDRHEIHLSEN